MGIKFYAHTNLAHHLESTGINRMHIFLIGLGIVMALIGIFMIFGWGIRDVLMARKLRRDNRYPPGFFKTTAYFNLMHNSPKRAALFLYIRGIQSILWGPAIIVFGIRLFLDGLQGIVFK